MFKESRVLMDTYCTITVVSLSREEAQNAIDAGFAEIKKLETLLNYFSEDSEVAAINRAAGIRPVRVSIETMDLMKKTMEIAKLTQGAFDPTLAPVIKLWPFSKKKPPMTVPSESGIKEALMLVDNEKITLDEVNGTIMLAERGMEIDLGGIAKGFGADKAVEILREKGIRAALVAIAGDIRGYGLNLSGQGWNVGIQNPRPATESDKPWEDIFAVLHLEDRAISTSGDYQRFIMQEGKRYHHILDPHTGYSAESGLISVSVIAPEGYMADSLSTALFVLGAQKGMGLMESLGLEAVLVTDSKEILLTPALRDNVEILNKEYQVRQ